MTKEEAIKVLKNIVKHNEDEDAAIFMAIRALNEQQPSLPSNLDEAAGAYAHEYTVNDNGNGGDDWEDDIKRTFIAAAEWRDQQIPKLPDNLDEAAEEYIKFKPRYDIQQELEEGEDPTEIDCFTIDAAIDAFKAGAEWMAGQGYTFETIMQEDDLDELVPTCPDMYNHGYSYSDKVIVQIRKKETK